MILTREEALKYHHLMWEDMRNALGDNPRAYERIRFKDKWCAEHFPDEHIYNSCFLCEYVGNNDVDGGCCGGCCLIDWPSGSCVTDNYYYTASISEILALPERKENKV